MFKKTIPAAVAVVLSLSVGAAVADQKFSQPNDQALKNDVTANDWRYVGGETGWELIPHAYEFRGGKLVHVDKLDHSTPKPSLASIEQGRKQYQQSGS